MKGVADRVHLAGDRDTIGGQVDASRHRLWVAFAVAVVAQLGPVAIMLLAGWTDDSPIAAVPLFTLPVGLLVGLTLLISPITRRLGAGTLLGTAVSLVVFGMFLFWLATALSDA